MIVQYRVQQNQFSHFSSFTLTLFCCDLFDFFLCFQHSSFLVCSLSVCLSTEEASLNCVSFPCVVYFLFIFSVKRPLCIQYYVSSFSGLRPRPPPVLCPWTPLRIFRPPDSLFCPPANFWLRPCAAVCQHAYAAVNWLSMSLSRHTCQISLASSYFPASYSLIR